MNVLYLMIPISLTMGLGFLLSFIWSVRSGQMDDTETPAFRMLEDDRRVLANVAGPLGKDEA